MDSMRSLNKSLPSSSSSSRPAPPEQLLQAFRTAALSVTNLYKSAVSSKQAGYQEALDDLLSFLDRENLGLQDGEGWRVRQWATERYDGSAHQGNESDDDKSEVEQRPRSISPVRQPATERSRLPSEPPKVELAVQSQTSSDPISDEQTPTAPVFRFTGHSSTDDMQTDESGTSTEEPHSSSTTTTTGPLRLEVLSSRSSKTAHKSGNQRGTTKAKNSEFTFSSGTKRKLQFPDFFDISNIGPRDGAGGNKRNRMS